MKIDLKTDERLVATASNKSLSWVALFVMSFGFLAVFLAPETPPDMWSLTTSTSLAFAIAMTGWGFGMAYLWRAGLCVEIDRAGGVVRVDRFDRKGWSRQSYPLDEFQGAELAPRQQIIQRRPALKFNDGDEIMALGVWDFEQGAAFASAAREIADFAGKPVLQRD
ncbi:MAG: hypothetical protein AAF719_14930 [Pseudomonadota bacterium]